MTKDQKNQEIAELVEIVSKSPVFYLTDTAALNAEATSLLRRECFKNGIKMRVVKNTLLRKALERIDGNDYSPLYPTLKGNTAVLFAEVGNVPARMIKEFRKKFDKPEIKSAFVLEECYTGGNLIETLVSLKSKKELLGDVIGLLQSPASNLISALQANAGGKVAGLVKALEER